MARPRSRVKGAAKLQRVLRKLPDDVTAEVKEAIAESGFEFYAEAFRRMPKPGSGHPYADGTLEKRFKIAFGKAGLQARVGSWGEERAHHIHLVEFGAAPHTIRMPDGGIIEHPGAPAQPFLLPAYEATRNGAIKRVRVAVSDALRRVIATGKAFE